MAINIPKLLLGQSLVLICIFASFTFGTEARDSIPIVSQKASFGYRYYQDGQPISFSSMCTVLKQHEECRKYVNKAVTLQVTGTLVSVGGIGAMLWGLTIQDPMQPMSFTPLLLGGVLNLVGAGIRGGSEDYIRIAVSNYNSWASTVSTTSIEPVLHITLTF